MTPTYRIIRTERSSVSIEIEDGGGVLVRAPVRATDAQIERVVCRRRPWIAQATRAAAERAAPAPAPFVAGSSVYLLGRHHRLKEAATADVPLAFDGARFVVREDALSAVQAHLRAWFEREAARVIPPLVVETARRLGLTHGAVRVADLTARWGSFSAGGALTFNWRLLHAPLFVLRYVIAHELAHTVYPHHGADFWNLVRAVCPRADAARAWLVAHEADLERL